jgi:hypothetical protein
MHSARTCSELQEELVATTGGHDSRHRSAALATVFTSVAFLEALVNEVFQDAYDNQPNRLGDLVLQP